MSIPNPCPKCGSDYYMHYQIWDPYDAPLHYIRCEDCLYQVQPVRTIEKAIENWNAEMPVSDS